MVKIEKNRPLPSHTKLNYDECYAKLVLEKFFPDMYSGLLLSDKPDLRGKGKIGIEVTSAIPKERQEAISLACEIPYLTNNEQQNKRIAYLMKKGYQYTDYGMTAPVRNYSWSGLDNPEIGKTFCKDFLDVVTRKLEKLNSENYEQLNRYDLFVTSDIYIEEWMPEKLMEKLVFSNSGKLRYAFIYLLALNGLFVFDMLTHLWDVRDTEEKLYGLGELARQMVEEGEENDKT